MDFFHFWMEIITLYAYRMTFYGFYQINIIGKIKFPFIEGFLLNSFIYFFSQRWGLPHAGVKN